MNRNRAVLSIIWSGFFIAVILYHGVIYGFSYAFRPEGAPEPEFAPAIISYILLFIGIFCLLAVINMDLFMLSRPGTIRISASQLPPGTAEKSEQEILSTAKATWFQMRFIILCAVAETPGVLALVLNFMAGDMLIVNILLGLAYFAILYAGIRLAAGWGRMYLE